MDAKILTFRMWTNGLQLLAVNSILVGFRYLNKNAQEEKFDEKIKDAIEEVSWKTYQVIEPSNPNMYH